MRNLMLRGRYLETKPVPFCHAACLSSCSESRAQIKGTRLTSKIQNKEHEDMPNRRGISAEEAMMATADHDWRVNTRGDYEMHPLISTFSPLRSPLSPRVNHNPLPTDADGVQLPERAGCRSAIARNSSGLGKEHLWPVGRWHRRHSQNHAGQRERAHQCDGYCRWV